MSPSLRLLGRCALLLLLCASPSYAGSKSQKACSAAARLRPTHGSTNDAFGWRSPKNAQAAAAIADARKAGAAESQVLSFSGLLFEIEKTLERPLSAPAKTALESARDRICKKLSAVPSSLEDPSAQQLLGLGYWLGNLVRDERLSARTRDFYATLSVDPASHPVLNRLRQIVGSYADTHALETIVPFLSQQPAAERLVILDAFQKALKKKYDAAPVDGPLVTWSNRDTDLFLLPFLPKQRAAYRLRLFTELRVPAIRLSEVPNELTDLVHLNDTPETRELFKKLIDNPAFMKLSVNGQEKLFYYLNRCLQKAEASTDVGHRRLLRNTVDVIASGSASVSFENLEEHIRGDADADMRHIRFNDQHADYEDGAIETLAHEVSHILNKAKVETNVGYFEEEMRAWAVGRYAATGRLPNKQEAAYQAQFLLTYPDTDGAYYHINYAWQQSPSTFAAHLNDLGLGSLKPGASAEDFQKIIARMKPSDPAALWGWDGFLVNKPPPPGFVSGQRK